MSDPVTPEHRLTPRSAEAVVLSRRHVLVLALLSCIPLPLLSIGATLAPLPNVAERVAATLVPFVDPTLGENEGRVARERDAASGYVEIQLRPSERTFDEATAASRTAVRSGLSPSVSGTTPQTNPKLQPTPEDDGPTQSTSSPGAGGSGGSSSGSDSGESNGDSDESNGKGSGSSGTGTGGGR